MPRSLYQLHSLHGDSFCAISKEIRAKPEDEPSTEVWLGLRSAKRTCSPTGQTMHPQDRSFVGELHRNGRTFGTMTMPEKFASQRIWEQYNGSKSFDPVHADCTRCKGEGFVDFMHPLRPGVIAWRLPCKMCNEGQKYPDPWPPPIMYVTQTKNGVAVTETVTEAK